MQEQGFKIDYHSFLTALPNYNFEIKITEGDFHVALCYLVITNQDSSLIRKSDCDLCKLRRQVSRVQLESSSSSSIVPQARPHSFCTERNNEVCEFITDILVAYSDIVKRNPGLDRGGGGYSQLFSNLPQIGALSLKSPSKLQIEAKNAFAW